jgi:4-hydroxythreonine-4-phosphate dehydrogenase
MDQEKQKALIGITLGDINGIGPEVILKAFQDKRMAKYCDIVIYGHAKVLSHYKRLLNIEQFEYTIIKSLNELSNRSIYVLQPDSADPAIDMGNATAAAGELALQYLDMALSDLKDAKIDALITAPLNKSMVKVPGKDFKGHTDYIRQYVGGTDVLMILAEQDFRVALVTGHLPLKDLHKFIDQKTVFQKIELLNKSLKEDFLINRPKIAVLGLNPHAGDNGLLGKEEQDIIGPAISQAKDKGIQAFGPFPADGFFGAGQFSKFDAVLAMYHDQGLIPFKALAFSSGVNFSAGLPVVRTSPDHGTAYDIAGKNMADAGSMESSLFLALDIIRNRADYAEMTANPLARTEISSEH